MVNSLGYVWPALTIITGYNSLIATYVLVWQRVNFGYQFVSRQELHNRVYKPGTLKRTSSSPRATSWLDALGVHHISLFRI